MKLTDVALRVRDLMEFYDVPAYTVDQRLVEIHPDDGLRDVQMNLETCLEELAMSWGLDWQKIDGLSLPASRVRNGSTDRTDHRQMMGDGRYVGGRDP